jgi:hypothetical protein
MPYFVGSRASARGQPGAQSIAQTIAPSLTEVAAYPSRSGTWEARDEKRASWQLRLPDAVVMVTALMGRHEPLTGVTGGGMRTTIAVPPTQAPRRSDVIHCVGLPSWSK